MSALDQAEAAVMEAVAMLQALMDANREPYRRELVELRHWLCDAQEHLATAVAEADDG